MKLVFVCFLVALACVSAQDNNGGLLSQGYKMATGPARAALDFANDAGRGMIDMGGNVVGSLDKMLPINGISSQQRPSGQDSAFDPLAMLNSFNLFPQRVAGAGQDASSQGQQTAGGLVSGGANGGANGVGDLASQFGNSVAGLFGQSGRTVGGAIPSTAGLTTSGQAGLNGLANGAAQLGNSLTGQIPSAASGVLGSATGAAGQLTDAGRATLNTATGGKK